MNETLIKKGSCWLHDRDSECSQYKEFWTTTLEPNESLSEIFALNLMAGVISSSNYKGYKRCSLLCSAISTLHWRYKKELTTLNPYLYLFGIWKLIWSLSLSYLMLFSLYYNRRLRLHWLHWIMSLNVIMFKKDCFLNSTNYFNCFSYC